MNLAQFADSHGVDRATSKRWKDRGLVRCRKGGAVDLAFSNRNLKAKNLGRFAAPKKPRVVKEPDGKETTLADVELRKQFALMRAHELAVAEEEGRLGDLSIMRAEGARIAGAYLDNFSTMAARRAHEMAADLGVDAGLVAAVVEKYLRLELKAVVDSL